MPVLPSSLSPHICILPSPDLNELLTASSLPTLPQILQSFSPIPNVTTRTTSLTPVPHKSFAIRFSDLAEIEAACRENEAERAVRTIDWMSQRISKRCAIWVQETEDVEAAQLARTPWWEELKRCAEGDHVPSSFECWNHPVAVILAVSTTTPNPLQALTTLHARALEFPSWVDPAILRYTLIIHPQKSSLTDEEATALFNAVKKQYGLESYLLSLSLPTPPPAPVPVPTLLPRLPPLSSLGSPKLAHALPSSPGKATVQSPSNLATETGHNTLTMAQDDIQATAQFTREFLCRSILPWMEKCVLEWNENFSSTRRLPSRLFSSTRRLFGTASPSPVPSNSSSTSLSTAARPTAHNVVSSSTAGVVRVSQQRRLAEFATILGDFKVAINIWESLRKESNSGGDVLPILLPPSPAIPPIVSSALLSINPSDSEPSAHSLLRGLLYAVRWEIGIASQDFTGTILGGEQWLVWAAGNAEELPSALLLGHAALLSARKQLRRKAALWYLFAANRLEKCGIKPLTMYFLRRAHESYKMKPVKTLSPSFWDSEGLAATKQELDAVISGIQHPLGRLLYTTGDIAAAVRLFLGLLRGSSLLYHTSETEANGDAEPKTPSPDGVFVEDFRIALTHFMTSAKGQDRLSDLRLPFTFCLERQVRVRLPRENIDNESAEWEKREEIWRSFWREHGREGLQRSGKAFVDETFWVDLALQNPLDTEVNLSNLTIVVQTSGSSDSESTPEFVQVEVISEVVLGARETRIVPISIKSTRPAELVISLVKYDFLSVLSSTESLASHNHPKGFAPEKPAMARHSSTLTKIEVEPASDRLFAEFVDDSRLVLAEGEIKEIRVWLSNAGATTIREIWMVSGPDDEIWVDSGEKLQSNSLMVSSIETFQSCNSLAPQKPYRIDLTAFCGSPNLEPGENIEFSLFLHADITSPQDLRLLFVFRQNESEVFHSTRVLRSYEVRPILTASATAEPSISLDQLFTLNVELGNLTPSDTIRVRQLTALSASWKCTSAIKHSSEFIPPNQSTHVSLGVIAWDDRDNPQETMSFVAAQFRNILTGTAPMVSSPPPVNLVCSNTSLNSLDQTIHDPALRDFLHSRRLRIISRSLANSYPHLPSTSYPSIFPLYHPFAVDLVVFWDIPSQQRSGHLLISGITLGANHAILGSIIDEAESAKAKRSMYAETRRKRYALLEDIRNGDWNTEMNPLIVTLQDGTTIHHDFTNGSFSTRVPVILRNYSLTHPSRFTLRLRPTAENQSQPHPNLLLPQYSGQLTYRGTIQPLQVVILEPTVWINRPGSYSLAGWSLETEVGECRTDDSTEWCTRHRYIQSSALGDSSCIIVCNTAPNSD